MGAHTAWSPVEIPLVSDLCVHPPRTRSLYLPVTGSRPADFPLLFSAPSLLVTCPPPLVIRSSQTPKGIFPSLSLFFSFSFLISWEGGGGKARPPPGSANAFQGLAPGTYGALDIGFPMLHVNLKKMVISLSLVLQCSC